MTKLIRTDRRKKPQGIAFPYGLHKRRLCESTLIF